jgi:citrate lyase beta subunit
VTRPRRRTHGASGPATGTILSIELRPTRRALLFCPATERHKVEKSSGLGVDAVILDLEDGIARSRKAEARAAAVRALDELDFGRTERLIRVNPPEDGQEEDVTDTAAARHPPDGYVLPKVESASRVRAVAGLLRALERRRRLRAGTIRLLAIIETALGVVNLADIAAADPRLDALIFGAEDLCGDIGGVRTREGREVAFARSAVAIHAAARRLLAIDTPFVDLNDDQGLRAETRDALTLGYTGKLAIHPRQVGPIQETFTPNAKEIEEARSLIDEHERQQARGSGVFVLGGRMVDMPMVRAARAVLARARAAGRRDDSRG